MVIIFISGNLERKKIIDVIRKNENFIYNTDPSLNKDEIIVCRRPAENYHKTVQDFTGNPKCKGWFTKNNIKHYFKQCAKISKSRNVPKLKHEYISIYPVKLNAIKCMNVLNIVRTLCSIIKIKSNKE